jgi:hypothetical protein
MSLTCDAKMAKASAEEEERERGVGEREGFFSYLTLCPVHEMMEDFILLFDAPNLKELISFLTTAPLTFSVKMLHFFS